MTKIEKVGRAIFQSATYISAVLLVGWVFIFVIYIVGRIFGIPWLFVEEYTGYWLIILAFVPLAHAAMTEAHMRTDIVVQRIPLRAKRMLQVCTDTIGLLAICYLLGRSIEQFMSWMVSGKTAITSLHTLLWPTYLPICIGLTLFAWAFALRLGLSVMALKKVLRGGSGSIRLENGNWSATKQEDIVGH